MNFNPQLQTISEFISANLNHIAVSLGIALATFVVLKVLKGAVIRNLRKYQDRELVVVLIERINKIGWLTLSLTAVHIIVSYWPNTPELLNSVSYFAVLAVWGWQAIRSVGVLIDYSSRKVIDNTNEEQINESIIKLLANLAKALVWVVVILLVVANLGYDINSLIAGLGIGGIAVALAVQAVLGDFISSISIAADKPFKVGDFIIVGDFKGTVEKIGVKSTRVASIDGEEIILPNSELVNSMIRNYGVGQHRRSLHTIGIVYNTDSGLVKQVPEMIKAILRENEMVETDTFRVHLIEFGASGINYEVHFYVKTFDYSEYLDVQQDVLLTIKDKFESEDIEFAFPTQTVYVNNGK